MKIQVSVDLYPSSSHIARFPHHITQNIIIGKGSVTISMLKRLTLHHVFTKEGKICVHPHYNLSKEVEQK